MKLASGCVAFGALLITSLFCACTVAAKPDVSLGTRVDALVNDLTKSKQAQENAVLELVRIGEPAVPYLVGHLGDERMLAEPGITLENADPNHWEATRHYDSARVNEALPGILNGITYQAFVHVNNGSTLEQRVQNRAQWVAWCVERYPKEAVACRGSE